MDPWSRVFLENMRVTQPVKTFPAFYETRRFITVDTRPPLFPILSQLHPIHTLHSLRGILMLPSHLCLRMSNGSCLLVFQIKFWVHLWFHACYLPHQSHPSWFDHRNNVRWRVKIVKLLLMLYSPASHHFLPLRSKDTPQCPVLKHPHSTIFV